MKCEWCKRMFSHLERGACELHGGCGWVCSKMCWIEYVHKTEVDRLREERDEWKATAKAEQEGNADNFRAAVASDAVVSHSVLDLHRLKSERDKWKREQEMDRARGDMWRKRAEEAESERDKAVEELADYRNSLKHAIDGHEDEQHCACFPYLRAEVMTLRTRLAALEVPSGQ